MSNVAEEAQIVRNGIDALMNELQAQDDRGDWEDDQHTLDNLIASGERAAASIDKVEREYNKQQTLAKTQLDALGSQLLELQESYGNLRHAVQKVLKHWESGSKLAEDMNWLSSLVED